MKTFTITNKNYNLIDEDCVRIAFKQCTTIGSVKCLLAIVIGDVSYHKNTAGDILKITPQGNWENRILEEFSKEVV